MFNKPIEYEKYKPKTKQMIKEIFSNTKIDYSYGLMVYYSCVLFIKKQVLLIHITHLQYPRATYIHTYLLQQYFSLSWHGNVCVNVCVYVFGFVFVLSSICIGVETSNWKKLQLNSSTFLCLWQLIYIIDLH